MNHPELADLSEGGLCTVRLITERRSDEDIRPLIAAFKMPLDGSMVDNFGSGGLCCPIKIETGIMGPAASKKQGHRPVQRHPDTDGEIVGRQVPRWQQVMDVAVQAHHSFENVAFIGWDIAITPDGPVIVVANTFPCACN